MTTPEEALEQAIRNLASQVVCLVAQRKQLREALEGALKQLSALSTYMQCTADGNSPDCADYFQAQINASKALKDTE